MNNLIKLVPFLCLSQMFALAQSKEETINFLVSEFKSFEDRTFTIREFTFSPGGDTFTMKQGRQTKGDKGVVVPLKNVDIYCVPTHKPNGVDVYRIVIQSRGVNGMFMVNGVNFLGTYPIAGKIENERKAKALEKAFNHLIALVTDRKPLF